MKGYPRLEHCESIITHLKHSQRSSHTAITNTFAASYFVEPSVVGNKWEKSKAVEKQQLPEKFKKKKKGTSQKAKSWRKVGYFLPIAKGGPTCGITAQPAVLGKSTNPMTNQP